MDTFRFVNPKRFLKHAGLHLIAEFWGAKAIENKKELKKILIEAAKKSGSASLEVVIHKFKPRGITGVIVLAESHLSVHSWPEIDYLAIDIFSCGKKATPEKALEYLRKKFRPKRVEVRLIRRGVFKKR